MHGIISTVAARIAALFHRHPTGQVEEKFEGDWLPPVFGPADWSNTALVSMVDAAWYFDRRRQE